MLESDRLRIRQFTEDDRDAFVRWHTHPPNREFKWDGPLDVPVATRDFDDILDATVRQEPGYLAIERLAPRSVIGQIGLFPNQDESIMALAYLIDEAHWGFGYATEAARAMVDDCRRRHPARALIAVIPDGHTASERVAVKLGMVPSAVEERNGMTVRRWELRPAQES